MARHSCKQAAILLTRSVDGSLGWLGRLRLAWHLRVCSTCPQLHRQLLFLRQAAQNLDRHAHREDISPDLTSRLKRAIREVDEEESR